MDTVLGARPLIFLLALLITGPAAASSTESQRQTFLNAEKALKKNNMAQYRKLKRRLSDYPLLPYLERAELLKKLNEKGVNDFLDRYGDTPLAARIRGAWLEQLARQGRWHQFVEYFEPTKYTRRRCQYLRALINTGHADLAYQQVPQLWLVGHSQPNVCDPVFDNWRKAGHLSKDLVWQRVELAIRNDKPKLATYLERFLPKSERPWVDRWVQAHANPDSIRNKKTFAGRHPRRADILLYGLERMARIDAERTADNWRLLRTRYRFDQNGLDEGNRIVARSYIRHNHPDVLEQLDQVDPGDDEGLQAKRILTAIVNGDWKRTLFWIESLPEAERNEERWRYWRARALQKLNRNDEALALFTSVAEDRTYYAFLAADRIGSAYFLQHIPLDEQQADINALAERPAARRAKELRALDRRTDARREWRWLTRKMDNADLKTAAALAKQWAWHDQAIFTLARSGYWDDLELRFPLEHLELVEENAGIRGISLPWVLAIMRQESAFADDAVSRVGARGLMQLMPATARQVAKSLGQRKPKRSDLLRPATNIPLGTAYLSQVYNRLERHPVLATAAYNAGPHRVKDWLPERTMDADVWVELIPFKETRNYVKRVMAYAVIYEKRLGRKPASIVEKMRPISGTIERAAAVSSGKPDLKGS